MNEWRPVYVFEGASSCFIASPISRCLRFARLSRLDWEIGYFSTNDMFPLLFSAPFSIPVLLQPSSGVFSLRTEKICRAAILLRRREFTATTNRSCTRSVYTYVQEPRSCNMLMLPMMSCYLTPPPSRILGVRMSGGKKSRGVVSSGPKEYHQDGHADACCHHT